MRDKDKVIEQIIEEELRLFLAVPALGNPQCRENLDGFRLHRRVQFIPWSVATLESYLNDIGKAGEKNENPLTLKYAQMMGAVEPVSENPLVGEILEAFCRWQQALREEFPYFMGGSRPINSGDKPNAATGFADYFRGELQTYSDGTLKLLWADVKAARESCRNMCRETYEALARELRYVDIDEAERVVKARKRKP